MKYKNSNDCSYVRIIRIQVDLDSNFWQKPNSNSRNLEFQGKVGFEADLIWQIPGLKWEEIPLTLGLVKIPSSMCMAHTI